MSSVPDIIYNLTSPWDSKHPEPLAERLTEAGNLFLNRHKQMPNVALISGGDWPAALALTQEGVPYSITLSNGKTERIQLQASPFGGQGLDVYMGRIE